LLRGQSPQVVVVSDDLTGAVAAAGESSRAGATTEITFWDRMPSRSSADALVVDTNSRLLSPNEAAERIRTVTRYAVHAFGQHAMMYKRVDSLLRGNTQAEMRAWADVLQRPVVVAPCAPSYGITTEDGNQKLWGEPIEVTGNGADGTHVQPCQLIESELMSLHTLTSPTFDVRLEAAVSAGRNILVDSASLADLRRVAAGIHKLDGGRDVGVAGSYGLLGAWLETALQRESPGALIVATSYRAATRRQIDLLAEGSATVVIDATGNSDRVIAEAITGLRSGKNVALITVPQSGGLGAPRPEIAVTTAHIAARVLAEVNPAGLVLLGGEVSSALIRLLGPTLLSVVSEPWPATPVTRLHGGPFDGLLAVIQSGSQGEPTRTIHAIDVLASLGARRTDSQTGGF
jgi:uncharacterized protein YgbK (DUF1537 family)